jgi:micrococcal nuclease
MAVFAKIALSAEVPNPYWALVDKAIDGDTLRLKDGRSVRLIGIDAPEIDHHQAMAEPWAVEAWQLLSHWTDGCKVRLVWGSQRRDSHGRLLAHVFDDKGIWLNHQLILQGAARVLYVEPNTEAFPQLLKAQQAAIRCATGLWKNNPAKEGPCLGNSRSKRFHRPQCDLAQQIRPTHQVSFASPKEACYQGYAPCKRCIVAPKKELKHR